MPKRKLKLKNPISFVYMLCFGILLCSCSSYQFSSSCVVENDYNRIYIYLADNKLASSGISLEATCYLKNGFSSSAKAVRVLSHGICHQAEQMDNRFFYLDLPNNTQGFNLFQSVDENNDIWNQTGITLLQLGKCYFFNYLNYTSLEDSSGWNSIVMSPLQFADYVLYDINPSKMTASGGYMQYPNILSSFLVDNLESSFICWTSQFTGEEVSLPDVLGAMEENYSKVKKQSNKTGLLIIIPVLTGLVCLGVVLFIWWKQFGHGKK